jgi:hypothetical protein
LSYNSIAENKDFITVIEDNNIPSGYENGLLATVNAARKAVPAVDFALGTAGIAAAAALISIFLGKGTAGYVVLGITFISMVLLLVFAGLVRSGSRVTSNAGKFLLWAVVFFFVSFLGLTLSAVIASWPRNWTKILGLDVTAPYEKMSERERNAVRDITTWLCASVDQNLNLQITAPNLKIDNFSSAVLTQDEKNPHWFVSQSIGSAFQIQYRYAIDEESKVRYGQRLIVSELNSSRFGALRGIVNREAFLRQFGNPEDYALGRRVGSEAKLDDEHSASLIYVTAWGGMPVVEVEWWDDASIVHFKDMCKSASLM